MATELKHTVKPSGGDYTTLADAIAHLVASHADLVSANLYANIEIDGTWSSADTTAVTIPATILTSATCYLKIYTTAAARHNGTWDTGAYMLTPTNAAPGVLSIGAVDYLRMDGLQLSNLSPSASDRNVLIWSANLTDGANDIRISNCIAKGHGHATRIQVLFDLAPDGADICMWNCIGFNLTALVGNRCVNSGVASTGTVKLYSSTMIGGEYAVRRATGTVTAKNVYAGGSLSGDYNGTITKTTCASSDSTGSAGLQSIPVSADTFVNVGAGTEDYHLAVGSALIGVGTDTSGDAAPMDFTTDIDGDART